MLRSGVSSSWIRRGAEGLRPRRGADAPGSMRNCGTAELRNCGTAELRNCGTAELRNSRGICSLPLAKGFLPQQVNPPRRERYDFDHLVNASIGEADRPPPTLLCVSNFASNTGYAWDFIEGLYARVAESLATRGIRTIVAYPKMRGEPRSLAGSPAVPVEMDFGSSSRDQRRRSLEFVKRNNVKVIYLTDREACSPFYPRLRRAGVRNVVMHDHTSGARTAPRNLKKLLKWGYARLPGVAADTIVCVSDYVARRQRDVGQVPASRVVRIWNGIPTAPSRPDTGELRRLTGSPPDSPIIACCCRADPVKGVMHLLQGFEKAHELLAHSGVIPSLIYFGHGPQFEELERTRDRLESRRNITFAGYREDAANLLAEADLCVVPSVWQDALPLGVLEPMAAGRAVVATSVGGIPEMVIDGVTGLIVPPGDEAALAAAMVRVLRDPSLAAALGAAARERVTEHFSPGHQIESLTRIVERGFD